MLQGENCFKTTVTPTPATASVRHLQPGRGATAATSATSCEVLTQRNGPDGVVGQRGLEVALGHDVGRERGQAQLLLQLRVEGVHGLE